MRAVSPIRLSPLARMFAFAGGAPTALYLDPDCRRPASYPVVADDRGWFPPVYTKADVDLRYRDKDGRDIAPPEDISAPPRVVERVVERIIEQAPPPQIIERVVEREAPLAAAQLARLSALNAREAVQGLTPDEEDEKRALETRLGVA